MPLDLDAYCQRISYRGPREPTIAVLEALHLAHTRAIPFENLDPLRGVPVALDDDRLQAKILLGRRGGYCFEQNRLFRDALIALGFEVEGLAASVLYNQPPGVRRPRTHMVLRVQIDGEHWLADVGFGGAVLAAPLRFQAAIDQTARDLVYRLLHLEDEWRVEAVLAGAYTPLYQFDLRPFHDPDYELANWYTCTWPASHFRKLLIAARILEDGRATLLNNQLRFYPKDAAMNEVTLRSATEIHDALEQVFDIKLPDDPALERAFERVLRPE